MRISDWSSDVCSSDLLERGHGDVVAVGPQADAVVLEHRLALRERFAQQRIGEALALVDGQGGAGQLRVLAGAVAALGRMHAVAPVEHPVRQRRVAHRLAGDRSEEHTSELQSLMRISYAVFCLKKKKTHK